MGLRLSICAELAIVEGLVLAVEDDKSNLDWFPLRMVAILISKCRVTEL